VRVRVLCDDVLFFFGAGYPNKIRSQCATTWRPSAAAPCTTTSMFGRTKPANEDQRPKGNEAALVQVQLRLPSLLDIPGWPGTAHKPACLANLLPLTSGSSLPHGKASASKAPSGTVAASLNTSASAKHYRQPPPRLPTIYAPGVPSRLPQSGNCSGPILCQVLPLSDAVLSLCSQPMRPACDIGSGS
jgi:hypothetical protein